MPLCTLELPSRYLSQPGMTDVVKNICEPALDTTLIGLKIPDPSDREYRVLIKDKLPSTKMTLSFTRGADEYGTGEIFYPSDEQMLATGIAVQSLAVFYGVRQTRMEAWENTTFMTRSNEPVPSPHSEEIKAKGIKPIVTLTLSPWSVDNIPHENQRRSLYKFAYGLLALVDSKFEISRHNKERINIVLAQLAETDYAVDVDFPEAEDKPLSEEDRLVIAQEINGYLNDNPYSKSMSATIWVRQGKPITRTVTQNLKIGKKSLEDFTGS